jgi:protein SCO1
MSVMTRREVAALAALGSILVITAGWWALALWPLPPEVPEWVVRARAACFGSTRDTLPHAGGWILLVGTPLSLTGVLMVIWGRELREGLAGLAASGGGRAVLIGVVVALLAGLTGTGVRVANAAGLWTGAADGTLGLGASRPVDEPAPPLRLLDHRGAERSLEEFRGRPVLVTFAYGKCHTICPLIVRDALEAQRRLGDGAPEVLIVTLDPWRDVPSRLPHVAEDWGLGEGAHLLGGSVDAVESVLDAWSVARSRDLRTGEVTHPSLIYVIDRDGRIAYASGGRIEELVRLVRAL